MLFTFYIQGVLKLKKNNSGTKRLKSYEGARNLYFPPTSLNMAVRSPEKSIYISIYIYIDFSGDLTAMLYIYIYFIF